ncbi:hypothetical protein GCM10028805_26080 [Spirosoma harenae]
MENIHKPFNQLLEHYVFSVANQYIHCVNTKIQTQFINLVSQLNQENESLELNADVDGNNSLLNHTLLTQWEKEIKQLLEQSTIALLLLIDM